MHNIRLIKYFFYLASNWNLKIAIHILLAEIKGEKKYGINTTGADELQNLEDKGIDIGHATIYMPASYDLLEIVFDQLKASPPMHLIDFGCGRGRVLCVAAYNNINKLTGLDISKEFCDEASENLRYATSTKPQILCKIINNDAFYFDVPEDADCLFFFNPFDEVLMSGVVKNVMESLKSNPRKIKVIYFNPLHKKLFTDKGFEETFHVKKLKYLEASLLSYDSNKEPVS